MAHSSQTRSKTSRRHADVCVIDLEPQPRDSMQHSSLVCVLAAALLPFAAHGGIKAGFAERDITPDVGMEVPGGYGKAFSKQIHDPCKARIAVFDDGRRRIALVGLDALIVPRALVLEARAAIETRSGIPPDCVMIGASHSHSSGP